MRKLLRITTKYIEIEDRLRMDGETSDGAAMSLWLTQRLLIRLAKKGIEFLDEQPLELTKIPATDEESRSEFQSIMQQSAKTETQREDAVLVNKDSQSLIIREIDLKHSNEGIVLVFRESQEKQAMLVLSLKHLRQWLGILCKLWQQAEWPMDIWPNWVIAPEIGTKLEDNPLH